MTDKEDNSKHGRSTPGLGGYAELAAQLAELGHIVLNFVQQVAGWVKKYEAKRGRRNRPGGLSPA